MPRWCSRTSWRGPPTASRRPSPPGPAAEPRPGLTRPSNPARTAEALAILGGKPGQDRGSGGHPQFLGLSIPRARGRPEGRRQAIADLESLIGRESATPEVRRRLAQLLEAVGEWPRAREQYRELILRADAARDADDGRPAAPVPRPVRRGPAPPPQARRRLRPGRGRGSWSRSSGRSERGPLGSLILEAQIDLAARQPKAAAKRFRDFAVRSDVSTAGRWRLADAAEAIGLVNAAEWISRRTADEPPADRQGPPNKVRLAFFLARHGKVKDAVDICEGLWADADALRRESLSRRHASRCSATPAPPVDAAQARRVIVWLEQGQAPRIRGRCPTTSGWAASSSGWAITAGPMDDVPHGDQDQ